MASGLDCCPFCGLPTFFYHEGHIAVSSARRVERVLLILLEENCCNVSTDPDGLRQRRVTLLARLLTAGLPVAVLRRAFNLPHGAWQVLTWGGLRGGVSVALALSLPASPERDIVVALTYCVVVSSILAQGLSIGPLARRAASHR